MFNKLDMIDNQPVLTKFIDWGHDDIISDVTVDLFRLELSAFQACEHYNFRSLHPMFTTLDMVDNQLVITNYIEWRH